jgi:hypothetical protein
MAAHPHFYIPAFRQYVTVCIYIRRLRSGTHKDKGKEESQGGVFY